MMDRQTLLRHGFDARFFSGEDIELRWRLQRAGVRIGVSRRTVVEHRFAGDDFGFARDQFLADGRGLARLIHKRGLPAAWLIGLPLGACLRGVAMSLVRREPKWIPYYLTYMLGNYVGMLPELRHLK
jgi:GT2 family glycosyltransferase